VATTSGKVPRSDAEYAAVAAAAAAAVASRPGGARSLTVDDVLCGESSVRSALDTIGGAWSILVLTALRSGPCRYSEIKRAVRGISDRRLSGTLRDFVRDGLTERRVLSTIPSHVEYELTPLGREVSDSVSTFVVDIMRLAPRVAAARAKS